MSASKVSVIIVGGGLVGASLALAMRSAGVTVALIDSTPRTGPSGQPERPLALSLSSRRILETLDLWSTLAPAATPITAVHVSERQRFGVTRMTSEEFGEPALGYVVEASQFDDYLTTAIDAVRGPGLSVFRPAQVLDVDRRSDGVTVELSQDDDHGHALHADLLIAADGMHSGVRQLTKGEAMERDYQQVAITGIVTCERAHGGRCLRTIYGPWSIGFVTDGHSSQRPWFGRCLPFKVKRLRVLATPSFSAI